MSCLPIWSGEGEGEGMKEVDVLLVCWDLGEVVDVVGCCVAIATV